MTTPPEVWLRGPVAGVGTSLQPAAHALLQAAEDLERLVPPLTREELWTAPGGAASVGFHVRHLAGSLDRLVSYARGEALTQAQREALEREKEAEPALAADDLLRPALETISRALDQLRRTADAELDEPRSVGRARLPSSVRGLLYHAAEHTARHVGQISTTEKVVRGLRSGAAS